VIVDLISSGNPTQSSVSAPDSVSVMSRQQNSINAIIIGAGPSGIAMAHSLKFKLGFDSFTVKSLHSHAEFENSS
jgi:hypothetical protein